MRFGNFCTTVDEGERGSVSQNRGILDRYVYKVMFSHIMLFIFDYRTDPACRIAVWDVHELQLPYISGDTSNLPPG